MGSIPNCIMTNSQTFLYIVGSDGNIRLWSIRSGELMHCVHKTSTTDEVPHITYSASIGGCDGKPGLLVTENESILIYHV